MNIREIEPVDATEDCLAPVVLENVICVHCILLASTGFVLPANVKM
jgi:hypothetical protein